MLSKFYDKLRLEIIRDFVLPNIAGKTIVDIGCADGFLLLSIKEEEGLRLGVDIVTDVIKQAKRAAKKLKLRNKSEFLLCNAEDLCFRDESVDVVIGAQVLEHVADPLKVIEESGRILKKGRFLVLSLPAVPFIKIFVYHLLSRSVKYRSPLHLREYAYRKHSHMEGLDELIDKLTRINFRVLEIRNLGVFYFLLDRFVWIKPFAKLIRIMEWQLSKITPALLSGIFFIIKAVKE